MKKKKKKKGLNRCKVRKLLLPHPVRVYFSNHLLCSLQSTVWISRGHEISSNSRALRKYIFIITKRRERCMCMYIFRSFLSTSWIKRWGKKKKKKKRSTLENSSPRPSSPRSISSSSKTYRKWHTRAYRLSDYSMFVCAKTLVSRRERERKRKREEKHGEIYIFIWKHSRQSGFAHKMAIITPRACI